MGLLVLFYYWPVALIRMTCVYNCWRDFTKVDVNPSIYVSWYYKLKLTFQN